MALSFVCPQCQTENRETANFCRRCGRLLVEHCPHCHISLLPDSDYCDNCGRPLTPAAWTDGGAPLQGSEAQDSERTMASHIPDAAGTPPAKVAAPALGGRQRAAPINPRLEQYIPAELRQKIDAARTQGEMVGERRIVTMLFCDVKGSTAAAEGLDPEEWTEIINGAFEHMIKPVYTYEGTVARLMGDGILAFFGAPLAHEDDAQRAVLAGLDIVDRISGYRQKLNQTWGIDIQVRVGINTGLVVVGTVGSDLRMEYSAMGDAINLAARMEQTAEPGTVQIARDTYKIVRRFFEFEDLGSIAVKGKAEPVQVYKVLARKWNAGEQWGIRGLQAALVGREDELGTLQKLFGEAQQGNGRIVAVIGEAGLGKSRLVFEARRFLKGEQTVEWIETSSLSYERNHPYAVVQRLIRRLGGIEPGAAAELVQEKLATLARTIDEPGTDRAEHVLAALFDLESAGEAALKGEAFKRELYEIMPALWRRRFAKQPTILVFDDMHWSDRASIELLLHLFPLAAEIPLVFLCVFRPERGEPVWWIKTTAETDFHHLYSELIIRPLGDEQVKALISGLFANADIPLLFRSRILESAAGNPLFVEEVVRTLIDTQSLVAEEVTRNGQTVVSWRALNSGPPIEIPDNLQSLLAARIDRLEEKTRQIVQTAAVIGRTFYRKVLAAIEELNQVTSEETERQLARLLHLEMIQEAARLPEVEYRFSNPLTQEVAYQTILIRRRRELHRRVGMILEALFPEQLGELAPQLAHHFAEAEEHDKAFDYYLLAGDSAARLFANAEAVSHYTQALGLIEKAHPDYEELEALYSRRGRALELLSRYDDALANYEAMLQLAQERNDRRLELAATVAQATIRSIPSHVYDGEISLRLSTKALDLANELGDASVAAKIHWNLMLHYQWAGSGGFEQAVEHGEAAVLVARESNLSAELGPILSDLAVSYFDVGRLDEALRAFAEGRAILRDEQNLPLLALNFTNSATVQFLTGHSETALTLMREAEEIDRSIGNNWGLAGTHYYRSMVHFTNGRWGDAIADVDRSIEFCEIAQAQALLAAALLARANYLILTGAVETALPLCRRAQKLLKEKIPYYEGFAEAVMCVLYLALGDQRSAREAIKKSLDKMDLDLPPKPALAAIDVRTAEIKFLIADGRPELAAGRADDLLKYLDHFHVRQFRSDALLLKGRAYMVLDRLEGAAEILDKAYREAEALATQPVLWQILDAQAELLERLGVPDEAASKRDQARAVLTRLAGSFSDEADRNAFLNLVEVRRLTAQRE